jgi:hypothetical protein
VFGLATGRQNRFTNVFTVIILEDVKYVTLKDFLPTMRGRGEIMSIVLIMQILHTLYMFQLLGIKHLDLHFGNILVTETPPITNGNGIMFDEYIISKSLSEKSVGLKFWLPVTGITIKVIDYDGAVKFSRAKNINYEKILKNAVPNPAGLKNLYANPMNTPQTNFYKVLAHLKNDHPKNLQSIV